MNAVVKSDENWNALLQAIARGEKLEDAMLTCRITSREIETALLQPLEAERWGAARAAGLRAGWSRFDIDAIYERVAAGVAIDKACVQVTGRDRVAELFQLIDMDKDVGAGYLQARRIAAFRGEQEVLQILDDTSRDVLETPKGPIPNNAAVQRDRARAEFRWKILGAFNPVYGETKKNQVNVQVNLNHAERLEECRERARTRGPSKRQSEAIDAEYMEQPVPSRAERLAQRRPAVEEAVTANEMRDAAAAEPAIEPSQSTADATRARSAEQAESAVTVETFGLDD